MTTEALRRGEIALVAFGMATAVALVTSAFLLGTRGAAPGLALAAALVPSLLLGFIGVGSRYLCRAVPLRTTGRSAIIVAHAGSAAAASALWVLAWSAWLPRLSQRAGKPLAADPTLFFGLGVLLILGFVVVHYLTLEVDASREASEEALRYRVLAREAELRAFKAQIDPHFLFNSLNAVASLCGSRPEEAREMAQLLADFFRLTLRHGSRDRIPLAQEIALVTQYLSIEQVRFGERLTISVDVDPTTSDLLIPPLLLQPLIENAVRHGIASLVEGGTIEITTKLSGRTLHIRVENPAEPDRLSMPGEGIGLRNARSRLSAISEGRASLTAIEADGRFRVDIELPQ